MRQNLTGYPKDWRHSYVALCGTAEHAAVWMLEAECAGEHPQSVTAPGVCRRIGVLIQTAKLDRMELALPALLEKYKNNLHWGRFDRAMDCMEQLSALALAACGRELRQLGKPASTDELTELLRGRVPPHRNRGYLKDRHTGIAMEIQRVLVQANKAGIRSAEDKQNWLMRGWSWPPPVPRYPSSTRRRN